MSVARKVAPVVVVVAAVVVAGALVATKPQPAIETPADNGEVVQVHTVTRSAERLVIAAKGTVIPAREVTLQPQVSGRLEALSPAMVPGGLVTAGDLLFSIDNTDYRLAVEQADSRVAETQAVLSLERGRGAVAEREWALFKDEMSAAQDATLALREPQLKTAQASVAAARSQLRQAQVNLSRTEVRAPFNAVVLSENVDLGQIVSPQTQAARLVGTDRFWIQVAVPVADLAVISVATDEHTGSLATVRYDTGAGVLTRTGYVVRTLADLDRAGQMARLHVAIDDPLCLAADADVDKLLLDSFVDVEIDATRDVDVVRLKPQWLRNGNVVHVYDDGVLAMRKVEVVWRQPDAVLIGEGLSDGDIVVTTTLPTPVIGMKLRLDESVAVNEL